MSKNNARVRHALVVASIALSASAASLNGEVNILMHVSPAVVVAGDEVEVTIALQASDETIELLSGIEVIFAWDPTFLSYLSADTSEAGYPWLVSGLFPNFDGLNLSTSDGDAIFSAFSIPGSPATAPVAPAELVVVKFYFEALSATPSTSISLIPSFGVVSFSRVHGPLSGQDVTGTIAGPEDVAIICGPTVGDVNGDLAYTYDDIAAAVDVYLGIDTDPNHIISADVNCDGFADGADIQPFTELLLAVL